MKHLEAFRLKLLLVTVFALAIVALWLTHRDIRSKYRYDKLAVLARFAAKDYCTCRYVIGQTDEYCREYVDAEIPLLGFRVKLGWTTKISTRPVANESGYTAVVNTRSLLAATAEARYYGEAGCRLEP